MQKKSERTTRQYLEPTEFFDEYPGRKRLLAGTSLEKYVSWVLMEQEPASKKMAYFLMSAASYGRACYDMKSAEKQHASGGGEFDLHDELAKLRDDNTALVEQLDDLKRLNDIRNSKEYLNADMARDKHVVQNTIKELQSLLDAMRLANPHYVEKIERRLEGVVQAGTVGDLSKLT